MTTATLTPYMPTLFGDIEAAIRDAVGLLGKDNVAVAFINQERTPRRLVVFSVDLPNGVSLELTLADRALGEGGWVSAGRLLLGYRYAGPDPLADPKVRPSLEALGKLFARRQRQDGDRIAATLWTEHAKLRPMLGLNDDYYRRIFFGVVGGSANLRLGFRCNQDCGFCWQSRKWPDPPAEMYRTWLDEIAAAGIQQIAFTGGEPTLHRALPDLLRRARHDHGMRTMLQTNAIQLSKPAVLKRIVEAGVDRLFVSFHAADAEISDGMTRAPRTHHRTVAGIKAALGAGMRVGLNCVVEAANHRDLGQHAAFIVENFVRPFPDNPIESVNYSRPQSYFDQDLWRRSLVRMDVLEPHLLDAVRTLEDAGMLMDITAGSCGLPACLLRSRPHLIYLPQPNEVGMADPSFDRHAPDTACGRCALRRRCQGPGLGYLQVFGDAGLVPFDEAPEIPDHFPMSL